MPVARPDILSCEGKRIYMRSQSFDLEGKRLKMGPTAKGPDEGKIQGGEDTHLFCPTGFLDDTWFHRTYWLYAQTWSSGWCGYYVAGKHAPAGKIICADEERVYAFGREPKYYRWTTPLEYRLFASKKQWKPGKLKAQPKQPARKKPAAKKKRRRPSQPGPVTNQENYFWSTKVPLLVRAMVLAGNGQNKTLFIAGPRDVLDTSKMGKALKGKEAEVKKQEAAYLGKSGGLLWAVSASDGKKKTEAKLTAPPVFDGMIAAHGKVYIATMDGKVICLGGQ
jgi:outer membrane protein assembly factor BamB